VEIVQEETSLTDNLLPSIVYSTVLWVLTAWFCSLSTPDLWVRLRCQAASLSRKQETKGELYYIHPSKLHSLLPEMQFA